MMITNIQHEQFVKQMITLSQNMTTENKQEYRKFQEHYFSSVAEKNLSQLGPEKAAFITRKQWKLAQKRKPKETLLQIYSPILQKDGLESEFTHIDIVTGDKPFLIDSISLALNNLGYTLENVLHPIFDVKRESTVLRSISVELDSPKAKNESFMHFVINKVTEEQEEKLIAQTLLSVLKDVEHSVNDWPKTRKSLMNEIQLLTEEKTRLPKEPKKKAIDYLTWLTNDNFIILGSAVFDAKKQGKNIAFTINDKTRLGLLNSRYAKSCDFSFVEKQNTSISKVEDILVISKSSLRSTVHRSVYCDTISIKRFDNKGNVKGELRFWGLYTSSAYRENPKNIPIVKDKIDYAFASSNLLEKNHKGKALSHVLVTYPRDELMSINKEDLAKFSLDIANLNQHQHASVYMRSDHYNRYVSCLVYIPRDSYDHAIRERIAKVFMSECGVDHYEYLIKITDESLVRLEMLAMLNGATAGKLHLDKISDKIQQSAKTWNDHLQAKLVDEVGITKGNILFNRFKNALPVSYRNACTADVAHADIQVLETMSAVRHFDLRVTPGDTDKQFNIRLFRHDTFIAPSDTMPIFNNMSIRVLNENSYKVNYLDGANKEQVSYIHDYTLEYKEDYDKTVLENSFKQSFSDIWHETVENDGLNKLIMAVSLTSREIVVFRAITKYLSQACLPFSQQYVEQTLIENKDITRNILELFDARFNPSLHVKKKVASTRKNIQKLESKITTALDQVASLDQDRILRNILSVVNAVVRTNFYQTADNGQDKSYVSMKLDTSKVLELPEPRPLFEIFVYSPKTEGVHLRGGKVARGGLRWSDRKEDFRTEVLGLMKAQMVKNSVIVPVGAKGGFVMKQAPSEGGREALMAEVVTCYKTFINALLDVTDNIINDKVVPPIDVVRHDEDDTYLVVAADKGTATFSDIANEISTTRNFWLGDAFASGGSIGYDHKKMGITAKGAWESVKLNFRDLGKDIQKQDFTVVGIGDMAGDVFGNGMLLSKHIKLLAAFNHMHIFVDPNPDSAASFKERKRLFNLPRSSWTDYNSELISKGGGIYSRSDKVIKLSQAARKALDIDEEQLSPDELINRILKSPVDLLWNGGIGTYIKSSEEQHSDAGDKANDGLRVNGSDLRCLCVGEGGNLGVTQKGRIEYALNGGRIDTDFIHNAGGVDCSDHEVNIKILLHKLLESGELTEARRVKLLESMTDDVSEVVLLSNYWQGQAITQVESVAVQKIDEHALYINHLERIGRLDRELEGLPSNDEIHQRKLDGKSLVRPEIAVLISYAKMIGYDALLSSGLWQDEYYANELTRYFPKALFTKFSEAVHEHPLRKEILSTFIVNRMINRMGPTFAFKLNQEIGASLSDVARAYTIAWEAFGLRHLWQSISSLDNKVDATLQTTMMLDACKLIERSSRWLIQHRRKRLGVRETINDYSHGALALTGLLPTLYAESEDQSSQSKITALHEARIPKDVATKIVAMDDYYCTFDIVEVANQYKINVDKVATTYFHVYAVMDVKLLRDKINAVAVDNHWQERNRSALIDDLYACQRAICESVIVANKGNKKSKTVKDQFNHWESLNQEAVEPYKQCLAEFKTADHLDMAMLSVAVRLLSQTAK